MRKLIIIISLLTVYSCTGVERYNLDIIRITKNVEKEIEKKENKKEKELQQEPYIRVNISSKHKNYRGTIYYKNNIKINEVLLEEYLYSVVASEMPSSFNIEALKAQAVAARTYAINNINNPRSDKFHLYDTVKSQVYKGISSENAKVKRAVDETRGVVAKYDNKTINALYHSSSGTSTNSSLAYYGKDVPYLQEVDDFTEYNTWNVSISKKRFIKDFRLISLENIIDLKNIIIVDNVSINKRKIREKYGLKSSNFTLDIQENTININGVGFGHGVGMSQYGANELSKKGYNYEYILKHYYTGITLEKIY